MKKKELAKRYILFIISLFISGLGIAFSKKAELGLSPISSVSNVLSIRFDALRIGSLNIPLTFGTWLTAWNCVIVLAQIAILRKNFQLIQLLQVPLSFLFGWFTDIGMSMLSVFTPESYISKLSLVLIGTVVLGFGIALSVIANVIMNSGEAFVKVLSDALHKEFGYVKIAFDISCVLIAIVLSLIFFDLKILGVREGTVIAAVCTGLVVKFFTRLMKKPVEKLLVK